MKPRTLGMVLIAVALIFGLIWQFRLNVGLGELLSATVEICH